MNPSRAQAGFTLVEALLASAIFAIAAAAVFQAVRVTTRCAHEQDWALRADAHAFDLAWRLFHADAATLRAAIPARTGDDPAPQTLDDLPNGTAAYAVRWRDPARDDEMVVTVDVAWGDPEDLNHRTLRMSRTMVERSWP